MAEEAQTATAVPTKYPAREIAEATGRLFKKKYTKALVLTALQIKGLQEATLDEAEKAVKQFANRKVGESN